MSRDYEPISTNGRQGPGLRVMLAIALIAFFGGIVLTGWVSTRYDLFGAGGASALIGQGDADSAGATTAPAERGDSGSLPTRVAELEDRLSRINVQAEAASGNAARAEGLLIAFATRRAIENGRPLGYLDQQLQLRFAAANPDQVRTIRAFAADPVQLEQLQSDLQAIGDDLRSEGGLGFFERLSREFSELFLVRKQGTASTATSARIKRARSLANEGNIRGTIAEVEKLPQTEATERWLGDARRYQAAQDAMEAMEMAAIFEPRGVRDSYGAPVDQASPVQATPQRPVEASAAPAESDGATPAPANAPAATSTPAAPAPTPASGRAKEDDNFFGF